MPLPAGPLAPGTRVALSVVVTVLSDFGDQVEIEIPSGLPASLPHRQLILRAALEAGEVVADG